MIYEIKPFKWIREVEKIKKNNDIQNLYSAITEFGTYKIELIDDCWYISYPYADYFTENDLEPTKSFTLAIKRAESHWQNKLIKTLVKREKDIKK